MIPFITEKVKKVKIKRQAFFRERAKRSTRRRRVLDRGTVSPLYSGPNRSESCCMVMPSTEAISASSIKGAFF